MRLRPRQADERRQPAELQPASEACTGAGRKHGEDVVVQLRKATGQLAVSVRALTNRYGRQLAL